LSTFFFLEELLQQFFSYSYFNQNFYGPTNKQQVGSARILFQKSQGPGKISAIFWLDKWCINFLAPLYNFDTNPNFIFLNSYVLPKVHSHTAHPQKKTGLFIWKIYISFWGRKKQRTLWDESLRVTSAFRMSVWCDVLNCTAPDQTNPSRT
jgi:hypothetical protein